MAARTQSGDTESAATTTEQVVAYIGTADVRRILKSDWNSVGVEDQEAVEWSAKNKFAVPVKDLSKGALAYLDKDDDGFVVKDA